MQKAWITQLSGLIAIVLLLTFLLPRSAQTIPEKIASHARNHLNEKGMSWAVVQTESTAYNRNILLSGNAPDANAQQTAIEALNSLWYVQQVRDATTPKIIEPYTLHLEWDGDQLTLDGYVSSDKKQTALAEQIETEFGGNANPEKLRPGLGAPEYWETLINTVLLKAIKPMQSASVRMVDKTISFTGKIATTQAAKALHKTLHAIEEQGYSLTVNIIPMDIVEPYTLHLQWDGNQLALDGYVSSTEDKTKLAEQAKSDLNNVSLKKLKTGVGAPAHWETLINTVLLKQIKPLQSASVRMIDKTISFTGKAATTKQVKALEKALEKALQPFKAEGYNTTVNVIALDNAAVVCQREFNHLLKQGSIVFSTGGASINQESNALLQELSDTAIFCADTTILISGHTDNIGNEEDNLRLSEQRAKAVKGWLFRQGGVPLERMKTLGKGASEPLADNDIETGRAQNRRIEFIVEGI